MPANIVWVRLEIKNQRVMEEIKEIIASLEGFRLQKLDDPEPGDLLIMEIGEDLGKEFRIINSIRDSTQIREVFVISPSVESDILLQALREGVKEFFSQPIKKQEVVTALLRFKDRIESEDLREGRKKRGRIIDVIGSKGGVGTTTIAVNLAVSLAELEGPPSVAVIDMNLLFGEIPLFLDIEPAFNWGEVARNVSRLDSTYLMSILSKHPTGVYVLPSPGRLDGINVATPEIIERLLDLMQKVFDFIVIDSGQSLDDTSLKILEMSDTVLAVGILSLPCLTNLKRLLGMFKRLGYPQEENIKIIISRYHKKSVISLKEAEKTLNKEIFWHIPNDYLTTVSAINQGKTISVIGGETEISKNLRELAATFFEKGEEKKGKSGFWKAFSK
jgi:pilus assembly protein CpaE